MLWSALRVLAGGDKILHAAHHLGVGCGYFVAQFAWYGTDARTGAVPIGWLVLALFFTQVALVRLNYRRGATEARD